MILGPQAQPWAAFALSFAVTAAVTPLVIATARRTGWVARPRPDRWHRETVALSGGIALVAGVIITWLVFGDVGRFSMTAGLAVSLFALGLVDDRRPVRPYIKLVGQLLAAGILVWSGVQFPNLPPWIAMPLTMFWLIGVTNALNLLDNMDGLAAGVSLIAAVTTGLHGLRAGTPEVASAAFAVGGACLGFLLYNFNPARIFMGDCGSLFLGFMLASLTVQGPSRATPNVLLSLLVPVSLLAIPIFDTTLVSIARVMHGRSLAQGGRDHSSHRMVSLGLSERNTVLLFYVLSAVFSGLSLLAVDRPVLEVFTLAGLLVLGLTVLGVYLGILKVYSETEVPAGVKAMGGALLYSKQVLQVLFDIAASPIAWSAAYLLRFEGEIPAEVHAAMLHALPVVVAVKVLSMALCRAYRGVWRYAGISDALRAVAGSFVGSLLTVLALVVFQGLLGLSRASFIIDWLLFTILAVLTRLGYLICQQVFARLPSRQAVTHIVVLGASEEGLALVQRLRAPETLLHRTEVQCLDNNPAYHGREFNGLRVVGPIQDLPRLLKRGRETRCVLGLSPSAPESNDILQYCASLGVQVWTDYRELARY